MAAFAEDLLAKETIYLDEKEKLKQLIEELQSIIEEQRKRIADLESAKEQQDIVIRSQIEQLNSKVCKAIYSMYLSVLTPIIHIRCIRCTSYTRS